MPFLRSFAWAAVLCIQPLCALAATPQAISFPSIPVRETSAAAFALTATASSGLPVSFEVVGGASVASVSGTTVTLSGPAGAYAIRATQAGNATYEAATPVIVTSFVRSGAGFQTIFSGPKPGHAGGIKTDGTLWMWGNNSGYALGLSISAGAQPVPVKVGTATDWHSGALGNNHTLVIKTDGTLWGFGFNISGQLGDGTTDARYTPVRIGMATDWKMVAGGDAHSAGVRQDGSLWVWGSNVSGQLGQGTTGGTQTSPLRVGSANDWAAVGCGAAFVVALKSNGTLWAWGANLSGQLGDGTATGHSAPAQVGTATDWKILRVGSIHALAIKNDGTLWGWGANTHGNLATGSTASSVRVPTQAAGSITGCTDLSVGVYSTTVVRADGTLWAAGAGTTRSIGDGTFLTRTSLVQIGTDTDWRHVGSSRGRHAVKTDGSLWAWGDADAGSTPTAIGLAPRPLQPSAPSLGAVRSAAAGLYHTLAVKEDGTLWSWGSNLHSQLGSGTHRKAPEQVGTATGWAEVAAGVNHSLALKSDGTLWAFGNNDSGQLGDGTTTTRAAPVQCGTATDWRMVVASNNYSFGLKTNGTLWAWGQNTNGILGDGTSVQRNSPVQIGSATWRSIACGSGHNLGIRSDGTLWAWGNNIAHQLGDSTPTTWRLTPVQIGSDTTWSKVVGGLSHSVGIKANGTLWGWGSNNGGQLGFGDSTSRVSPVQVGTDTDWSDILTAYEHTAALKRNGTLWSWGTNYHAQLGDGATVPRRPSPVQAGTCSQWKSLPVISSFSTCMLALTQGGILCAAGENGTGMLAAAGYDQTVPQRLHPAPSDQNVTLPAVNSPALGASVPLAAITSSGLPVSYAVSGPATLTGSTLTRTGSGPIHVVAYGAADASWQPAPVVLQTLLSNDASLDSLTVGTAMLAPTFAPATLGYSATVSHATSTTSLRAAPAYAGATLTFNSQPLTSGVASSPVALAVGTNTLTLQVLAEDMATTRTYTVTLTRETAYQTWAATNLGSSSALMTADDDHDGQLNLLEYAFGSAPQTSNASPVTQGTTTIGQSQYLRLTVPKNPAATDVTYHVEATATLDNPASWSSAGLVTESSTPTQLIVRDNLPVTPGQQRFMRVRVQRVP